MWSLFNILIFVHIHTYKFSEKQTFIFNAIPTDSYRENTIIGTELVFFLGGKRGGWWKIKSDPNPDLQSEYLYGGEKNSRFIQVVSKTASPYLRSKKFRGLAHGHSKLTITTIIAR